MQNDFDEQLKSFVNVKTDVELNKNVLADLKNYVTQSDANIEQNKTVLSNLKASQNTVQDKVGNLDVQITELRQLTEGMELEVIRQKKNQNNASLSISAQVSEVEHDLAQHIETIKTNMEEEVSVTKQNQKLIENKLANFTEEIVYQNSNLNVKIQVLQKEFEQLKTLTGKTNSNSDMNINLNSGSSHSFLLPDSVLNSNSNASSNLSFGSQSDDVTFNAQLNANISSNSQCNSNASNRNAQTWFHSCDDNHSRFNSCDPDPSQNENSFYMYGDTTRSLILDWMQEGHEGPLRDIIRDCINDMEISITLARGTTQRHNKGLYK